MNWDTVFKVGLGVFCLSVVMSTLVGVAASLARNPGPHDIVRGLVIGSVIGLGLGFLVGLIAGEE